MDNILFYKRYYNYIDIIYLKIYLNYKFILLNSTI